MSSIKIRTKRMDGNTQIRTLITHPMENGRRKNKYGKLIPAHHIQEIWVEHNQNKVINCHMAGSISKNPYFDFLLKGGNTGDQISIFWKDNLGNTDSNTQILK